MEIWLSILNKISLNISSSLAGTWSCCGRTGENCCCQSSSAPINNIAHWKCAEIITNTREGDVLCFAKYLEMLPNIFFFCSLVDCKWCSVVKQVVEQLYLLYVYLVLVFIFWCILCGRHFMFFELMESMFRWSLRVHPRSPLLHYYS